LKVLAGGEIHFSGGGNFDLQVAPCSRVIFFTWIEIKMAPKVRPSWCARFLENQRGSHVIVAKIWKRWSSFEEMPRDFLGGRIIWTQSAMLEQFIAVESNCQKEFLQTTLASTQVKKRCRRESISDLHKGQRRSFEGMGRREEILALVGMIYFPEEKY
jgi:hypothetical protein